jgi:hypothetical protein
MTDMSVRPLALSLNRIAKWVRIVAVLFAILVLMGLSFVVGRATIGHTDQSKLVSPAAAVVRVTPHPIGLTPFLCHVNGPC